MELQTLKSMLLETLPDASINIDVEGNNYTMTVVSDEFAGKKLLERQKMVMAPYKSLITSGDIHSLSIKTFTPEESKAVLL